MDFDDTEDMGSGDAGGSRRKSSFPCKMEADDDDGVEEVTPTASPKRMAQDEEDSDGFEEEEVEILSTNIPIKSRNVVKNPCHTVAGGIRGVASNTFKKMRTPDVIDLTEESSAEEIEMDDSVVILDAPVVDQEDFDFPELVEVSPVSKKDIAEDNRKTGNDHFKRGEYNQALCAYTRAIELVPNDVSYYGNRSACLMMMRRFKEALSDCQISLQIDSTYEKSYLRLVRVNLSLGDAASCERAIEAYDRIKPSNADIVVEKHKLTELKKYIADVDITTLRKDFRRIVYLCDRILEISIGDVNTKTRKAFALIKLGRHNDAAELAAEIMALNPQSIDAHIIRAICHYMLDNMDKSLCFFRGGLQYNPDAEEPKVLYRKVKQIKEQREAATDYYKQGKYEESKALYMEIMKAVVAEGELKNTNLECKFCFNLSLIFNKQRNYDEALKFANRAIGLNETYYKAFVHRGTVYTSKGMHEEAVRDLEAALKIDPSKRELRTEIQTAKIAAKRAKRKDYYKILDVHKTATDDEIRKAYKKRALMHHPDRHASNTAEVQKEQETAFKDVGEAYEVLSDSKKRFRYDQGQDLMDAGGSSGGGFYDPYDANQIFNMFFSTGTMGGGGMGGHGHSRGAGGPRYYSSNARGGGGGCSFNSQR